MDLTYRTLDSAKMRDYPLDRPLCKSSFYKEVLCGSILETFQYQFPVMLNAPNNAERKTKSENIKGKSSIYRARTEIRRLINCNTNFFGTINLFVTFTFADNIVDLKNANKKFTNYTKRLNRFLQRNGYSSARYLVVVEFQKRGAIHYHVVYFNLPFLPNIKIVFSSLWREGFVSIQSIRKVRKIGLYVSKYLQKGVVDQRLAGQKCYFTSRGLNRPVVSRYPQFQFDAVQSGAIVKLGYEQVFQSNQQGSVIYKEFLIQQKNDCKVTKSYLSQSDEK